MNQKEIREIKARFKPDKDSISRIYGCYVNAAHEIVTRLDLSVGMMGEEEAELYLKLLKKTLSGTLGKNLINLEFSTAQVENGDEQRLLQALRASQLKDESLRELLYTRIIDSLKLDEESYVILLASDSYDVPFKGSDDEIWDEGSGEVYNYILCCICPVKDAKNTLRYSADEQSFRSTSTGHILAAPELGFLFPAFDNRQANIYAALYYSKALSDIHEDFVSAIFNVDKAPMSADAQKNTFCELLSDSLDSDCSFELVRAMHGELRERLALHKESKNPEAPEIYVEEVDEILSRSGIAAEKVSAFNEACCSQFGDSDSLNPINLMETSRFEMKTPRVKISADPDYTDSIELRSIDNRHCLVIPIEDGEVQVNGISIRTGSTDI